MADYDGWEVVDELGEGGQGKVSLVRNPNRVAERSKCLKTITDANPWAPISGFRVHELDRERRLAEAVSSFTRPETPAELGALKQLRISEDDQEAIQRFELEITILSEGRAGVLRLLHANPRQRWFVTEYHPEKTIADRPNRYKGRAAEALQAIRALVETVASLHADNLVHRDIKPHNIFIATDGRLVLGDFGIVFLPGEARERVTRTLERVGPRDYMPQWANLGERLQRVEPNFDVYMLGKLLWCMVSGRLLLPREYHRRPEYNLERLFPDDPGMPMVNKILDQCVVEEPADSTAKELLGLIDEHIGILRRGGMLVEEKIPMPCKICGRGHYVQMLLEAVKEEPVVSSTCRESRSGCGYLRVTNANTFNSLVGPNRALSKTSLPGTAAWPGRSAE